MNALQRPIHIVISMTIVTSFALLSNNNPFVAPISQEALVEKMTALFKQSVDAEIEHTVDHYIPQKETLLSKTVLEELEIINPRAQEGASIKDLVDQTITLSGKIHLQEILKSPTHDIETLKKRQKCIAFFLENHNAREHLETALRSIKEHEEEFYTLWSPNSLLVATAKTISILEGVGLSIVTLLSILERSHRFPRQTYTFDRLIERYYQSAAKIRPSPILHNLSRIFYDTGTVIGTSIGLFAGLLMIHHRLDNPFVFAGGGFLTAISAFILFIHYYNRLKTYNNLAQLLTSIQQVLESGEDIIAEASSHKTLCTNLSLLSEANDAIEYEYLKYENSEHTVNIEELLDSPGATKSGFINYFIRNKGNANAAVAGLLLAKNQTLPLLRAIGELDVCLSCAKLLQEHTIKENHYCLPTFETAEKPLLSVDSMWHPMLTAEKAIGSSLSLGKEKNDSQHAIVTGPNAAGKSTMLRSVNVAVFLAQTLGIAPAKKMSLTPFSFIGTYLDIQDSLTAGVSTFVAEAQRAVAIYREHRSRPKNAFSLITMDEMFKGASEEEAPALSYSFARVLGEEPNIITLIASHFRIMHELEADTNGHFKNYMFVADESGTQVTYPYNIRPGASQQQIAVRILEEQDSAINEITKYVKERVRNFE